jgi:hypothetical protein
MAWHDLAWLRGVVADWLGRVSCCCSAWWLQADTMTADELRRFRSEVSDALERAAIPVAHAPLAVVCSDHTAGGHARGRVYPWGVAHSEAESEHSELPKLRRLLLTDGLLALKQTSQLKYEAYRKRALRRRAVRRALAYCVSAGVAAALAVGDAARSRFLEGVAAACVLPVPLWLPHVRVSWRRVGPPPRVLEDEPVEPPRRRWALPRPRRP